MRALLILLALAAAMLPAQRLEIKSLRGETPLAGVWRIMTHDDAGFASPDFDDANWPTLSLPGDRLSASSDVVWLRLRVDLPEPVSPGERALLIPPVAGHYQLFVNGHLTGIFGQPGLGEIPAHRAWRLPGGRSLQLALRIPGYFNPATWYFAGFHQPLIIGASADLEARVPVLARSQIWPYLPTILLMAATVMAALFFLSIPLWRPDSPEYFWCGLVLLLGTLVRLYQVTPWIWQTQQASLEWTWALAIVYVPCWERLFRHLFQSRLSPVALVGRWLLVGLLGSVLLKVAMPGPGLTSLFTPAAIFFALGLAWIYLDLFRRGRVEADAMLTHTAVGIYTSSNLLVFIFQGADWMLERPASAYRELLLHASELRTASLLLVAFLMAAMMNRRSARLQAERQRLAQELEAGAEVQAVLLQEQEAETWSWQMAASYSPASEVGGDFYYRLPDGDALVLVVGDVSGKGLRAAMLVTMIVGVLRETTARHPAAVLTALNRQLTGQTRGGFVTCCCARFEADGRVMLANAGHLPPVVDGRELEVPGLPLGVVSETEYEEIPVDGREFLFVSDGVIEAENGMRELFGFDRTRALAPHSAAEIAAAAKQWGQNDDITVVTVSRSAR